MPKGPSKRQQKLAQRQALARQEAAYDAEPEVDYAPPDPNTKITWPRMMAGQIDASKLPAVWPNNINRLKTTQKGRRISKEACCDNPIVQEMGEVCQFLKLTHVMEPYKVIPRDNTAYPGRIRVKIYDDDGKPVNEEITSRMDLMRKMGEMVPKLTIRAKRIKQERDRHEQYKAQYEAYVEKKIEKAAGPRKKKAGRKKGPGK